MKLTNLEKAENIIEALPYIKRNNGQIIVIKYGGNAMINEELKEQVMEDIALLSLIGIKVVLVHGGGPDLSDLSKKLGKETKFIDGLRVTDKETIELAQMVLSGKINKSLVNLIEFKGGNAMGISGVDGRILAATFKDERLGYVGKITSVNIQPVLDLVNSGYVPVISSLGRDTLGNVYNINADTAASYIAGALNAKRMILLTDVPGILRDQHDTKTLIEDLTISEARKLYEDGTISGGMIPKVECCIDAINKGVEKAIIMDGRISHSILMELLTNESCGTTISGDEVDE